MRLEYISAVGPGWIEEVFLAEVRARSSKSESFLMWIAADSSSEANYLLEKTRLWAVLQGVNFETILVDPRDPLLLWEDLVGSASEVGLLARTEGLVGVLNACFLPADFLSQRVLLLRRLCRAMGTSLLIPILHGTVNAIRKDLGINELFEVPRFSGFAETRRVELLDTLVESYIPRLDDAERLWLAKELVRAGPNSRAEAEQWLDYYSLRRDIRQAIREVPPGPPIERLPIQAPSCPTRSQLSSSFDATMLKLAETSNLFQSWVGRPLVIKIERFVEPFSTDNSLWWFAATVSALSCQLFDGTDVAFEFLLGYAVVDEDVMAMPKEQFFETLRVIRTAMQHGLDVEHGRTERLVDSVRSWFSAHCGKRFPDRAGWRGLTAALIEEWDQAVTRLRKVLVQIPACSTRDAISAQLAQFERRLRKNEWRVLIEEIVVMIDPSLDVELLLEKYLPSLQRELQRSQVSRHRLLEAAREAVSAVVVKESAKCPVGADELVALGIPRGSLLGRAKLHVERLWNQSPRATREDLIEAIRLWLQDSSGMRG